MTLRLLRARLLPLFVVLAVLGTTFSPAAAQTTSGGSDPRFFSQTNYRIDNDAFWNFFQTRGGVRTFGYPVSRQFKLQGFPVQIFQREVMQLQPDGSVSTLNLLDPGLLPYTSFNGSTFPAPDPAIKNATPPVSDPNYATDIIQFVDQQAPDTWNGVQVNFDQTFHNTVSYQDAFPNADGPQSLIPLFDLQLWGAPISAPAYDPTNHNFIYQRFQRGIMHYDAGCSCTQGILLADYLKQVLIGPNNNPNLPPDLAGEAKDSPLFAQYAPGQPNSLARPNDLPDSDLTNAFVQEQPGGSPSSPTPTPAPSTASNIAGPNASIAYGYQVQMVNLNPDAQQQVAGMVQLAGFNWLKQQINWNSVETAPGQYDWGQLDAIVADTQARGLKLLISVNSAPDFYRGPNTGMFPADPSTLQSFMQAMASRYAGKVQAYEIWNEENLDRETGTGNVSPSTYLPILKAGHDGVKAGDPNALVLLGALSPTGVDQPGSVMNDVTYLQQLYALNNGEVKNYYDVLSAHPSGFSNPPDCGPSTPQCSLSGGYNNDPSFFAFYRVGQYHDAMVAAGEGAKKIWFTEFGYDSCPVSVPGYEYCTSVTPQDQAQFLVRAFQLAQQTPYVGGMFVWNLNFATFLPQTDEKFGFSVLNSDWSPRPAYTALANMPKP